MTGDIGESLSQIWFHGKKSIRCLINDMTTTDPAGSMMVSGNVNKRARMFAQVLTQQARVRAQNKLGRDSARVMIWRFLTPRSAAMGKVDFL